MEKRKNKAQGFTLIEILVYIAIFAISATFLVAILGVVGRVQNRQSSANEVNQQISFVNNTIQRLVKESSLVENAAGAPSASLTLRMPQSLFDPTKISLNRGVIYLQQGATGSAIPLTNSSVTVQDFSVTKYENAGGSAVVQIDLTLSYNTSNPQAQITRTARTAITRISAATFDSSILPTGSSFTIGQAGIPSWEKIFLSRGGETNPSYTFVGDVDLGIFSPGSDIVGIATGGIERMRIDNNGKVKFSSLSGIGKVVCVKSDGFLGTCTGQPNGLGACDCQ